MLRVDSRKVEKNDTFIALRGVDFDGHSFINKAIENGACKIIAEEGNYDVETIIVPNTREYLINYLKETYNKKLAKLKIIGITGTNGKTTTAYLIHDALNKLGIKCGYIGTIGFYIGEKVRDLNNTTPDIYDLYEMFLECLDKGCEYVVQEVSSQGLAMKRVEGYEFDYAVFTNLTQDHLDYHKTMENYALAKQELFKKLKKTGVAIINYDDSYKNYFMLDKNKNVTYGFTGGDLQVTKYEMSNKDTKFTYRYEGKSYDVTSPLLGDYNVYNTIAMMMVLKMIGISDEDLIKVIAKLSAPKGRMEKIIYKDNAIIIDYAHTPDAMIKIISTMKKVTKGKMYIVFGCTGDRDRTKRPIMMDIACSSADKVIVTRDDQHTESQEQIYKDMLKDNKYENYEIIDDREMAIKKGIELLNKDDTLLILGKGHEEVMVIGYEKIPFSDLKIVQKYI